MLKAYKYRLYPNLEQTILLAKHFGCVRWVYNWALQEKIKAWETSKTGISIFELANRLPEMKKTEETNWLKEVNSQSLQSSMMNLDRAYTAFFKQRGGFPKFKRKANDQSFSCVQNVEINKDRQQLWLPKFKSGIKMVMHRDFDGKIKTATVSKNCAGHYFVSVLVETNELTAAKPVLDENSALGIDLGIKTFATLSDGTKIEHPRFLKRKQHRLVRAQKSLSRRKKGGKGRDKQRLRVAKIHEEISNGRKDFLHKLSHNLVCKNQATTLCIEDLSVKTMLENGTTSLSRNIGDSGWGMFRQFLTYKCEWYGKNLVVIGRFEASSKTCSCGLVNDGLTLNDRTWRCGCGKTHDRDILAANNIKKFAFREQNTICSKEQLGTDSPEITLGDSYEVEPRSPRIYSGE